LGEVFKQLAEQRESRIEQGHLQVRTSGFAGGSYLFSYIYNDPQSSLWTWNTLDNITMFVIL
jgi:hypothetical protein